VRVRNPWLRLAAAQPTGSAQPWLERLLRRNSAAAYLRSFGSPHTEAEFRASVPVVSYEDLLPWIERITDGQPDQLFAGVPIAFERTAGTTAGGKLIPYSTYGLQDFRYALLPWLVGTARRYGVAGKVYLSISPATRKAEKAAGIPIGLSDGAYLGEAAAAVLSELTSVPFHVAGLPDIDAWRSQTLKHLKAARDLELISVWSPTFLLRLLDELPDPREIWPNLKIVSCWTNASSAIAARELGKRLPHAHLQPKGLLSTECVVTVPDDDERPTLTTHGFFEFEDADGVHLPGDLQSGRQYQVIATTASGLYRYRTGDLVRYEGRSRQGRPILEFVGREGLVSDLVGEKLSEPFVERCLEGVPGFRFVTPRPQGGGYVLAVEARINIVVEQIEEKLCANPQYAYARRLGQLAALQLLPVTGLYDRYVDAELKRGVRLGDIKPLALRKEHRWATTLGEGT
jgi:hypothetical protein